MIHRDKYMVFFPKQLGYHLKTQSKADMGRVVIAGMIWKRSCINIFITCIHVLPKKINYEANKKMK